MLPENNLNLNGKTAILSFIHTAGEQNSQKQHLLMVLKAFVISHHSVSLSVYYKPSSLWWQIQARLK